MPVQEISTVEIIAGEKNVGDLDDKVQWQVEREAKVVEILTRSVRPLFVNLFGTEIHHVCVCHGHFSLSTQRLKEPLAIAGCNAIAVS